jgi:hypothetical protein
VQQAPDFSQAWFELANNYFRITFLQPLAEQPRSSALGLKAAERARTLDPDNGAAYAIDFMLAPSFNRWAAIKAQLDRAAALSPHDADVLLWRAHFELDTGHVKAAVPLAIEGVALNPLDTFSNNIAFYSLTYAGQDSILEPILDRVAAQWPRSLGAYWYRFWHLFTARRYAEAEAWLRNEAVKPPDNQTEEYVVLLQSVRAMASGDAAAKREAGLANLKLARLGVGYASNSIFVLAGLEQWDMSVDLIRALYLKAGPVKVDRSVQFIGDSRYERFDEAETKFLFHPFLKPLRASGRLDQVFDAIGLTAFWRENGPPDP